MNYEALKPCKFSKNYYVGDTIPGSEIYPAVVSRLIKQEVIKPIDAENGSKQKAAEKNREYTATTEIVENPGEGIKIYTREELEGMSRNDLIKTAKEFAVPFNKSFKNADWINAILEAQKG